MPDPPRRGRPSLRLPTYDYTQPGGYFVTLCTQHRLCLFGEVVGSDLRLHESGEAILAVWEELPGRFGHLSLDAVIVMPNHLHGILLIEEHRPKEGLGQIIGAFKSLTTRSYIEGVHRRGWPPFPGKLWQDNYFEHVIRDEASLQQIRAYIAANPARWQDDPERPV